MQVKAVIAGLKSAVGAKWQEPTWDGLQAGSLEAEVTGAAVAWSPTLDVLKRATAAGCNLLLTKAPLYWSEGRPGPPGAAPAARFLEGSAGGIRSQPSNRRRSIARSAIWSRRAN